MTDRPIDEVIAELERLQAAATAGPWVVSRPEQKGEAWPHGIIVAATARGLGIFASGDSATFPSADRELIAAMRNALPSLLASLKQARAEVQRTREIGGEVLSDYMTSEQHHPNHVLIPLTALDKLRSLLSEDGAP